MSSNAEPGGPANLSTAQTDLIATVRMLSEEIGPREAGSDKERLAAAYCVDRLRRAGFEVQLEPFQALKSFTWTYGPLYALAAVGGLLVRREPRLASLLGGLATTLFLVENQGFRTVSRLPGLPRGRSQNIVARLRLPPDEQTTERRVVLTAHLDTARAALAFHPAVAPGIRRTFLLSIAAMFTITFGSLALALRRRQHPGWPGRWITAAGAYLLAPLALLLHREAAMPVVPGANDNASGVAVLLAAAERLARLRLIRDTSKLRPSEIWIVLTGGEESGLEGMQQLLSDYGADFDRETTVFINVDNVGAGDLCLISEEGMAWPITADPELLDGAVAVALRRGMPIRVRPFHTMLTDAQVPLSRGLRALSIMGLNDHGLPPNWHWKTDTWQAVDPQVMSNALELVVRLVRRQVRRPRAEGEAEQAAQTQ